MSAPARVVLIAELGERRAEGFLRAAERGGLPVLGSLGHRELLADPARLLTLPDRPAWVRMDAPSDDAALIAHGGGSGEPLAPGELRAPAARHRGWVQYLEQLAAVVRARPAWRWLTAPAAIATVFDKELTARRLAAAGIATTPSLGLEAPSSNALFAAMARHDVARCFVKLRTGSSASGLAVVSRRGARRVVWTTMEAAEGRWFNSLRIQRLDHDADQRRCLDWILAEGARVEPAVPKVRLDGRHCDVRFVVVEGRVRLAVVRQSAHPITNLHLGGQRADAAALCALVGPRRWAEAIDACQRAATVFGAFMVGVDLLFRASDHAPRVIEVNAFGDLLPGLRSEGRDGYDWQVEALLARGAPTTGSRREGGSDRSSSPPPKSARSSSRSRCT